MVNEEDSMSDYHHQNLEGLGLYRRAGLNGNTDDMNTYIASFVMPEIKASNPDLRFHQQLSIHATMKFLLGQNK